MEMNLRATILATLAMATLAPSVQAQDAEPSLPKVQALVEQGKTQEALDTARHNFEKTVTRFGANSTQAAQARLPVAFALFASGKPQQGLNQLEQRVATLEQLHGRDSDIAIRAASDLTSGLIAAADQFENQGDWAGAEPHLQKIIDNYARFRGENDREALGYRVRLAINIKDQGRPAEAEPIMRRAMELLEANYGTEDPQTLNAINNLGRIIEAQFRHEDASPLYQEAYDMGSASLGKDDRNVLAYAQNLGASLMYQQRYSEAEPIIRDTLDRRKKAFGPDDQHTIFSMSDLATLLAFGDDPSAAGPVWEETVSRAVRIFGAAHPFTAQIRNGYTLYLEKSGDNPAAALAEAQEAADMIRMRRDAIGLDPRGQRSLATFTEVDAFYFQLLLQALHNAGEQQDLPPINKIALFYEAVNVMQEAMESPANMAVIRRAAERAAASKGPELAKIAAERQSLSEQWGDAAQRRQQFLANESSPAQLAEASQNQDNIAARIKQIDERFAEEFPEFFNLLRPRPIDAPDIQAMFKGTDEAALMVLPTPFGTHVMVISGSQMDWHVSELDERTVTAALRRIRWDLGADVGVTPEEEEEWSAEGEGAFPFDRQLAYGLYTHIVQPVEWVLEGKRHVYIVGGGGFSSLPFGVLVTEEPQGQDGNPADLRNTNWLADKYALLQLPSIQSLKFLRDFGRDEAQPVEGFLGFGDPALLGESEVRSGGKSARGGVRSVSLAQAYNPANAETGLSSVNRDALRMMTRLPGTARELEEMRQILGAPKSAVVTGEQATESIVKQTDLSQAEIIAFATHGLMAGEIDGSTEPGLVFTPPGAGTDSGENGDDGLLTMTEIAGLRMNASWVILSACNTAAGDGSDGATGLSGLAKSFFLAGAQSLLASHWPVRDDVAAKLTVRAIGIKRASPNLSRAEALQQAMQEIRGDTSHDTENDSWAHPNAWAPFTLIGDGLE